MKIRTFFSYNEQNNLDFNQVIYQQFRGSVWFNKDTFTAFEIEEINNNGFILPATSEEIILNILDSSIAYSLKSGDILNWGVPYKKVGEVTVAEIIIPCEKDFFGKKD